MTDLGQARRLARFSSTTSERSFVLALSHGMLMGRVDGLDSVERRRRLVESAVGAGVTGLILSPGEMTECRDVLVRPGAPGVWMTVGWTNLWRAPEATPSAYGYAGGTYRTTVTPDAAHRYGADGCHVYLLVGADDPQTEGEDIARVAEYIHQAHEVGLPVLVEAMARGPQLVGEERSAGNVAMAARMAYELGADMLKIEYPGSGSALASIVEDVAVPILVLGGAAKPFEEIADEARQVIGAGAQGIVYGRNVFQAEDPDEALKSLVAIVEA